ncbi:MAG: hypothetical protein KIH64_000535 [Mycobacterium sp.]|nr:hypothetical protein [Mycobacterium sp.]
MKPSEAILADVLGQVLEVEVEADGALTVRHDGTVAALRTLPIAESLEIISLTQVLAWDLLCTSELRQRVAQEASRAMFGTVTMTEDSGGRATVMLRYNFPAGVAAPALQILVPIVLDGGAELRRALVA